MRRIRAKWIVLGLLPLTIGATYYDLKQNRAPGSWRQASRASVGLAPDPALAPQAVIQVYAARAVRWRGYFGVHTWIAVKRAQEQAYTVYEVMGWRLRRNGTSVVVRERVPDEHWYGNAPTLIAERRGDDVDELITRIEQAVLSYPYADTYHVWPGPNSNTFTAHVLREVPELRADLPANAIGKDFLSAGFVARSPSGTGLQLNLYGLLGIMVGREEGLELNLLGLTFGIDPLDLALKLPLAGTLSAKRFLETAAAREIQATGDDDVEN